MSVTVMKRIMVGREGLEAVCWLAEELRLVSYDPETQREKSLALENMLTNHD